MPTQQSTRWCFTWNNPPAGYEQVLAFDEDVFKYLVYGRELGESGTFHLQGFAVFNTNKRFNAAKRHLGGDSVHVEVANGTSVQASEYCKKDGNFEEFGRLPNEQGRRTDLDEFFEWGADFIRENGRAPSSPECAKLKPKCYTKYPRACKALFHQAPPISREENPQPREWQSELEQELDDPADDRSILFYVDPDGNSGKTWFCRYLLCQRPDDVQILSIGKRDDVAHIVDPAKKIFLFNIPRGQMTFFQYSVAEALKDGFVQSNKYSSVVKSWATKNHVVVFCNEFPDEEKLSADRIIIRSDFN